MLSANSDSFTFSFLIRLLFILLLECSDYDSKTTLNKAGESGHFCHIPDLRELALRISALILMLSGGLS